MVFQVLPIAHEELQILEGSASALFQSHFSVFAEQLNKPKLRLRWNTLRV